MQSHLSARSLWRWYVSGKSYLFYDNHLHSVKSTKRDGEKLNSPASERDGETDAKLDTTLLSSLWPGAFRFLHQVTLGLIWSPHGSVRSVCLLSHSVNNGNWKGRIFKWSWVLAHTHKNGITFFFFRREKASLTLVSKKWHKCWVNGKTKCSWERGNAERGGRGAELPSGSVISHAASRRGLGGLSPVSDPGEPLSGQPLTSDDVSHWQPESVLALRCRGPNTTCPG